MVFKTQSKLVKEMEQPKNLVNVFSFFTDLF